MIPATYPPAEEIARFSARMLLEIQAVHFNAVEPFTLASGLPSPTYIDCRKLISYPRIRSTLMDFLTVTVMRNAGFEAFDNIAGGETAGIPFAAMVAERMALPMTYVRKKPKGYGRNARIEGAMSEGERVLLVEDLTTDGGSKFRFINAIRNAGGTCGHTFV
ncbi:MAG: orotate phosphoribosyltransferase, partial [Paracoccaceae bacterium]